MEFSGRPQQPSPISAVSKASSAIPVFGDLDTVALPQHYSHSSSAAWYTALENGRAPAEILSTEDGRAPSEILSTEDGRAPSEILSTEDGRATSEILSTEDGRVPSEILSTEDGGTPADILSAAASDNFLTTVRKTWNIGE
jgi:streptogramin lyase